MIVQAVANWEGQLVMTSQAQGPKARRFSRRTIIALAVVASTLTVDTSALAAAAITVAQANQAHDIAIAIRDAVTTAIEKMSPVERQDAETLQKVVESIIESELAKADNPLVANAALGDARHFLAAGENETGFTLGDTTVFVSPGIRAAFDAKQPQVIAAAIVYVSTSTTSQLERDQGLDQVLTAAKTLPRTELSGLAKASQNLADKGIDTKTIDNRAQFILGQLDTTQSTPTGDNNTAANLAPYAGQPGGQTDTSVVYVT